VKSPFVSLDLMYSRDCSYFRRQREETVAWLLKNVPHGLSIHLLCTKRNFSDKCDINGNSVQRNHLPGLLDTSLPSFSYQKGDAQWARSSVLTKISGRRSRSLKFKILYSLFSYIWYSMVTLFILLEHESTQLFLVEPILSTQHNA
jgi:hypothetical protein